MCEHAEKITLGLGIFCAKCKIRLGFLPKKLAENKIIKALENDIKELSNEPKNP
jgi:hypothetical protein